MGDGMTEKTRLAGLAETPVLVTGGASGIGAAIVTRWLLVSIATSGRGRHWRCGSSPRDSTRPCSCPAT
jgi:hypothetical protein